MVITMLKENKKIILYITYGILLSFFLFSFKTAINLLDIIFNLINPIIYGFIIAYILNIVMNIYEKKITNRNLSIFLSILTLVIIIVLTIILLIPQIINDIDILSKNIPELFNNFKTWINNSFLKDKISLNKINFNKVSKSVLSYIKLNSKGYIFGSFNIVRNIFDFIINIFLGSIISIIMLKNKEKYISKFKNYSKKKLSKGKYNKLIKTLEILDSKFQKYFIGQFIISLFIAVTTFIGMTIFKIPYALSISSLLFTLSLIPVLGMIVAIILSILLILAISVKKAIYFIILIFVIKQLSDYFIRPKFFEKNLDLPAILIVLSVIYFSLNFGVLGSIISIPITATIYDIYKKNV